MKHQLDATLCRLYFCRITLHVSGASAHHQEYLKTSAAATGTCVIVAGKSSHLLIRAEGPNKEMWWLTSSWCFICMTYIKLVFHLHQVGVSFDLYYDARKHKIKICIYMHTNIITTRSVTQSQWPILIFFISVIYFFKILMYQSAADCCSWLRLKSKWQQNLTSSYLQNLCF